MLRQTALLSLCPVWAPAPAQENVLELQNVSCETAQGFDPMLEAQLQSNYVGAWVERTISDPLVERRERKYCPPMEDET